MNTDDIEVGVTQPDDVVARVNAALNVAMRPIDDIPDLWWAMIDPDYRMSIGVSKAWRPDGYQGPDPWVVELQGVFLDCEDDRDLDIRRWIVGNLLVIAAWIGHSDPTLTLRVYAHSQNDALKAAGTSLDGPKKSSI